MGEAKTHCEVIVVGAGHEEGTVRYFVYNGGTPKFIGIIKDVAAKGYQEIEFRSGSGANVQAATASGIARMPQATRCSSERDTRAGRAAGGSRPPALRPKAVTKSHAAGSCQPYRGVVMARALPLDSAPIVLLEYCSKSKRCG